MTAQLGRRQLKPWQTYGVAAVATAGTLGFRLLMDGTLRGRPTLVIFTLPIMLSAYVGGLYVGLFATALSFLAASYYLLPPLQNFQIATTADRWQQFFVALAGVVISALNEAYHRARHQAEVATHDSLLAAAALKENEERFRTMANFLPQLAWITRADGFIYWYNQRWYDYTGTTPAQMEGWGWKSVHDPQTLPRVVAEWAGAIAAAETFEMEFPLRAAGGEFRQFLTRAVPLKDADGQVVQWFGTNTDITAQKEVEDALRESEERYRSLFQYAPDGILMANPDSYYVDANPSICRMLGYERSELIGLHASDLVERTEVGRVRAALVEVQKAPSFDQQEWQLRRKNGSFLRVEVTVAKLPSGYLLGMLRDMTEHYQAQKAVDEAHSTLERRVAERTAQLEDANKELEAFSYSVSHDLRAPLRAVNGFAGIMLEDFGAQLPEEGRECLERIRSGGERMGHLIDDLLAFSRLSRESMNGRRVDTAKLVQSVLEDLTPQCEGRQIEFKVWELPPCHGDPALLKQVWVNLLSNAIKYTRGRTPARIEIGCRHEKGEDVYLVRDNGAGFDMTYADKLFGVFQRLHRTEEFEGTGVGLAIVQRIVKRHGGRVWAEAEEGRGAAFHFTLAEEGAS